LLALFGVAALHLTNPLTWGLAEPRLCYLPLGIGLVLVAWLGPRAALLVAGDGLLVVLQGFVLQILPDVVGPASSPAALLAEPVMTALEAWAAWTLFALVARGPTSLGDPRSATLFLMVVPGCVSGLAALGRSWLFHSIDLFGGQGMGAQVAASWASRALGSLAVAPLLLIAFTPYLARWKVLPARWRRFHPESAAAARMPFGDWLEVIGLAVGTGLLGLVLTTAAYLPREISLWKIWGLPLLLVVWASLRQGILGASTVTAVATLLCLLAEPLVRETGPSPTLQGNLLAQCVTALLVGASVTWIRVNETRYRQVMAHIPVVLYSARIFPGEGTGRLPRVEIVFVSPASRPVLGAVPQDLQGDFNRWLSRIEGDDHELIFAAIVQLCLDHKPVTCEYRVASLPKEEMSPPRIAGQSDAEAPALSLPAARWVRDTFVPNFGDAGQLEGWEGMVADITEQRALASNLRRATGMLQALVANLPAGVFFIQGPTGQPILVNARARQLLGQRTDAAAGLDHLSAVYRLYRPDGTLYPTEELPVSQALRQGLTVMRNDIVVHRPDGRRIPLVTWAAPIDLGGQGKKDAAVWVLEDLTALHQLEAARLDSEARLRAVISTMAEGLIVQVGSGKIVDSNPAASEILGISSAALRERSVLGPDEGCLREDGSPFPPSEHPAMVSLTTRQPVRDVIMGIPQLRATDDGATSPRLGTDHGFLAGRQSVKWILASSMPLVTTAEPHQRRVVTTFADITAHRLALEVLRASEEKYRGLVETLPLMLVQFDRGLRIISLNPAFQVTTGYGAEEGNAPQFWEGMIHIDDRAKVLGIQREALAGQTGRLEARYRMKDESERIFYGIFQPGTHDGQVVGVTLLALDMTHQRRLERDLERAQRLDQVGRLASGIAHDFNNLLTVVLTLSDLGQDRLPVGHPVRDDLRRIGEAGEQASRLAAQLLTFSKQRRTVMREIDVSRIAAQTLDLLRGSLPPSISLEADLGTDCLYVEGDETQLKQVLMNLCLNARDAMPRGGSLRVRASPQPGFLPVSADPPPEPAAVLSPTLLAGPVVLLVVHDTGHGMEENVRTRIFEPFFSTKEHGTGLGLAVVKQIVDNFGGRIRVFSKPAEGTRIEIWLPAHPRLKSTNPAKA
jgi:PAS domain S-box-containing protein